MKIKMIVTVAGLSAMLTGCSASISTNTGTPGSNANKPAATPAKNTNTSSGSTSKAAPAPKNGKPLENEKKPAGTAKTASKNNPVPADWIYVYDETKGYGFSVPAGTVGEQASSGGVDAFVAATPAPSEIGIVVLAFKDKEMTKDDLLEVAVKYLEEMGSKVTPGKLSGESDDYAVGDLTTEMDGQKGKVRVLVGTDVTDNYVMLVGTDEAKFAANEKIIDEIWGSFEMWSGGASNN